jgi:hypothetical protein
MLAHWKKSPIAAMQGFRMLNSSFFHPIKQIKTILGIGQRA